MERPLGKKRLLWVRETIGWSHDAFFVPQDIYASWDGKTKGETGESRWKQRFAEYAQAFPALAAEHERRMRGALPGRF